MQTVEQYREDFLKLLEEYTVDKEPRNLYEPINYILKLGGKRLRPALVLMAVDFFGGDYKRGLHAAMAVEIFHNFTLVHDDIMDDAPLRRGFDTVHEKWDINTGILSGDAMLIMAFRCFEVYKGTMYKELMSLLSKTGVEVCEGQQWDVDFESRNDVTLSEYMQMIKYKTAVLLGAALKMGAIVAGVDTENQNSIYDFGLNLGLAFQLQDDYLDVYGDPKAFGKQVGGDIVENKKTFMFLEAMRLAKGDKKESLNYWIGKKEFDTKEKVASVKDIYDSLGVPELAEAEIKMYTEKAFSILNGMNVKTDAKEYFRKFGLWLMNRRV